MTELKDILYRNWIKAGLGLFYVKEGIQDFIVDEINNFHTGVLGKLPGAGRCTVHTIQNVLRCPTWGICSRLPCRFHDNTDPGKTYTPCPICDAIRSQLIKAHRYGGPAYKNTTAQRWCTTSWELAKCFMPATGYWDKNTADDTDLSGLISVILNHKDLQNRIAENLGQPGNKFEKVRQARNDIMHNAKMETPTTDLNSYFLILNDVLNDSKHLQNLPKVKDARDKLHQLQSNIITITTDDEQRVREESLKALTRKTEEGIHEIDTRKKESIEEIDKKKDTTIKEIEKAKEESVQMIGRKNEESLQEFGERELTTELKRKATEELCRAKTRILAEGSRFFGRFQKKKKKR